MSRWWKRLVPLLALLVTALFLDGQASRREPGLDLRDVSVVEGTVAKFDTVKRPDRTARKVRYVTVATVALAEYPDNVAFRLTPRPPGGVAEGSRVRLEAVDVDRTLDRAERFPEVEYRIDAVGAVIDGRTISSAAARVEVARDAANGYRLAAGACLLAALAWAVVLVMWWRRMRGERKG